MKRYKSLFSLQESKRGYNLFWVYLNKVSQGKISSDNAFHTIVAELEKELDEDILNEVLINIVNNTN
jgi:hypothetical protein